MEPQEALKDFDASKVSTNPSLSRISTCTKSTSNFLGKSHEHSSQCGKTFQGFYLDEKHNHEASGGANAGLPGDMNKAGSYKEQPFGKKIDVEQSPDYSVSHSLKRSKREVAMGPAADLFLGMIVWERARVKISSSQFYSW